VAQAAEEAVSGEIAQSESEATVASEGSAWSPTRAGPGRKTTTRRRRSPGR
jgi:hypothetical protein